MWWMKRRRNQGVAASKARPEDQPYTLWETQCELDLEEFAPNDFKGKGIPLPYLVTMEKDSRVILAVRRDWKPEDEDCLRKRMYVKWPYVPGRGFMDWVAQHSWQFHGGHDGRMADGFGCGNACQFPGVFDREIGWTAEYKRFLCLTPEPER